MREIMLQHYEFTWNIVDEARAELYGSRVTHPIEMSTTRDAAHYRMVCWSSHLNLADIK